MSPEVWGIIAIIAVGGAAVAIGWARDQARHAHSVRELAEPPPTKIPRWDGSDARYIPEAQVLASARPGPDEPTAAEQALLDRRAEATTIPSGATEGAFLNYPGKGLAILADPVVLVCAGEVSGLPATLNVLAIAARQGRPFVWVAADFDGRVLDSLRANTMTGKLRCLPVFLSDPGRLRTVARSTGGSVVPVADLAAGYLPDAAWGTCAGWISDLDDSWIVTDPPAPPQDGA